MSPYKYISPLDLKPVGGAMDYEALLAKYIRHVVYINVQVADPVRGDADFLISAEGGWGDFTPAELSELRRLAEEGE